MTIFFNYFLFRYKLGKNSSDKQDIVIPLLVGHALVLNNTITFGCHSFLF